MSYEGSEWFVCSKGHVHCCDCYMAPDKEEFRCSKCGMPCAAWGSIDHTNGSDYSDYNALHKAASTVMWDWRDAHPDDYDIVRWHRGDIITHREHGGVGVVVFETPGDEDSPFEPLEPFVRWTKKPKEVMSAWLSTREDEFCRLSEEDL